MARKFITLEEHYYSNAILQSIDPDIQTAMGLNSSTLRNVDEERIASMDRGAIGLQVISHGTSPTSPSPSACSAGNNELAASIHTSAHVPRFAAFAVLPVSDPAASARELVRCVRELGFLGALVDSHADGKHFDGPAYDALWQAAQDLDVPIYLHPTFASPVTSRLYEGNVSKKAEMLLGTVLWGSHGDVAVHVLKLFLAGVFDRFPRLKIVLGHMGEGLPFFLDRCIAITSSLSGPDSRQRALQQVWDENIWITTSGVWSLAPFKCILHNTKIDRILYSVDYPAQSNEQGSEWFAELERSGLLSEEELQRIAFKNAEELLKVRLP